MWSLPSSLLALLRITWQHVNRSLPLSVSCVSLFCMHLCVFAVFKSCSREKSEPPSADQSWCDPSLSAPVMTLPQRPEYWTQSSVHRSHRSRGKKGQIMMFAICAGCNRRHSRNFPSWSCPVCCTILVFPCHLISTAVAGRQNKRPLSCTNKELACSVRMKAIFIILSSIFINSVLAFHSLTPELI